MIAAFTGHRPKDLCGYDHDRYVKFVAEFVDYLEHVITPPVGKQPDEFTFRTGGAQGFDQLAFWAVHKIKTKHPEVTIHNNVYIPFPHFEARWPENTLFGQRQFRQMLGHADEVVYVSQNENLDEVTTFFRQYATTRNHAMLKDADMLFALYQGDSWNQGGSGTAEAVRWAFKHKVPVTQIDYTFDNEDGDLCINEIKRIII